MNNVARLPAASQSRRRGTRSPRVTVGIPAYNAERYIEATIESLRNQSFDDFELIVSDNASSDGTADLVAAIAARDPRIRLVRQTRNIGANMNYSGLVALARGEYFKWGSSSDWCAPTFLECCVGVLDRSPDVVLACPSTQLFESSPDDAVEYPYDLSAMESSAVERFWHVAQGMRLNNVMNGVVRTGALRRTRLIEHFPGADKILIGHLALLGKLALLPDRLFYRRMAAATATKLMSSDRVRLHHYPTRTSRSLLPTWRTYFSWTQVVLAAPLSSSERRRALAFVLRMCFWDRASLLRDVAKTAFYPLAR